MASLSPLAIYGMRYRLGRLRHILCGELSPSDNCSDFLTPCNKNEIQTCS